MKSSLSKAPQEASKSFNEVQARVPLTDMKSLRYSGKLLQVQPGHLLTFTGKTSESAESFDFFLGADDGMSSDFGDIQLHVSVRFAGNLCIIRNSYTKGIGWDSNEERNENFLAHNNPNPIERGGNFKFSIYVDEEKFYLTIDEKPFCTFDHRKKIADIKQFSICGDVEHVCQVNHSVSKIHEIHPFNRANFNGSLPKMSTETAIVFSGICKGAPKESKNEHFVISLIEVASGRVLIQVIANFESGVIVAITQDDHQGLSQQLIEKPTPFPFDDNGQFKTAIGVTNHNFVVTANGQHFLRVPFDQEPDFLGHPVNFQIATCAGLEIELKSVDVVTMQEEVHFEPSKNLEDPRTNKLLAQIYHH